MREIPVFIDTDIGTDIDDALALAFAVRSPELKVLGVGTVSKESYLRARIACKILELSNSYEVKIAPGNSTTLEGTSMGSKVNDSGESILNNIKSEFALYPGHAADLLIEVIDKSHEKINVVAIGPLTNIALALKQEPRIKHKINRLYIMGGCVYPKRFNEEKNLNLPELFLRKIETNLNSDPKASEIVFQSGVPITIVPNEITLKVFFTKEDINKLNSANLNLTNVLTIGMEKWTSILKDTTRKAGLTDEWAKVYLHDPLTIAAVFNEELLKLKPMHLYTKMIQGVFCTLIDENKKSNIDVAVDVDVKAIRSLLVNRLIS